MRKPILKVVMEVQEVSPRPAPDDRLDVTRLMPNCPPVLHRQPSILSRLISRRPPPTNSIQCRPLARRPCRRVSSLLDLWVSQRKLLK